MPGFTTEELARRSRISCVRAVHVGKSSHVGSSLSIIDMLSVLYGSVANIDSGDLANPDRDIIIVSKGHAAAGTYAVLANVGIIPLSWLDDYCADGSHLGGHVTSHLIPGVELSTGSLGHGLPFGVGIALAAKRSGSARNVYVIMSDGECDEGTTWESALVANHHHLDNLIVAVDRNGLQSLTTTEETLSLEPFAKKWQAFGWNVLDIDGHDHAELTKAFSVSAPSGSPRIVICNTTKGKGVSFMENQVLWHYRSPNDEQLQLAVEELSTL